MPPRLTQIAHERIAGVLSPGNTVVDGTAGNGFDTEFLARCVAPGGRVFAFDIQAQAIAATHQRISACALAEHVVLVEDDHARVDHHLTKHGVSELQAAMFNLGFLPGADKDVTTRPAQTLAALNAVLQRLRPGGLLSTLVYRHHVGGAEEYEAVAAWMQQKASEGHAIERLPSPGPVLYLVTKE